MNLLDIIRRSRLLDPNIQLDNSEQQPIPPGIMNAGKPPDDLSSIPTDPIGQPKALPTDTSNEDNLLDLFRQNENHPALDAYKDYIAKPPTRDDPSTGRKIFAALAGFAGGASGTDPNAATDILDAPYKRKVEDYNLQGKGLAESAQLEHLTSTDKIKTMAQVRMENRANQEFELDKKKAELAHTESERKRLHDEATEKYQTTMSQAAMNTSHAAERRADAAEYKAEHPTERQTRQKTIERDGKRIIINVDDAGHEIDTVGDAPLSGGAQDIVDASNVVHETVGQIREMLNDPEVSSVVGSALSGSKGTWEDFKRRLGASQNSKTSDLAVKMGLLEAQHLKTIGMRGSTSGIEALHKMFRMGLGTNLKELLGSLKAVDTNAADIKESKLHTSPQEKPKVDLSRFKVVGH